MTNNEAHSWVEAYMPGLGWMPFEPTIGFSGVASIEYDIEMDISDPETPEMKEQEQRNDRKQEKPEKTTKEIAVDSEMFSSIGGWVKDNRMDTQGLA